MSPTTKSWPRVLHALLALAVGTGLLSTAQAQFIQQGGKLVGTGAVRNAEQGYSVALSADGNTAIVGGFRDNGSVGAAWVYARTGGVWNQQGGKLVGTGAVGSSNQGYSVGLSADGNTAIVGGHGDNGSVGAAWVFARSGGVWTQQGSKLVGTGAVGVGSAAQGFSVALSGDGNTALVGGFGDNYRDSGGVGAAWVYVRAAGTWNQQGGKLVGTGAVGSTLQGWSVALSVDGKTAIVGGIGDNGYAGAAWVYTCSGGVWNQQGGKLVGTGAVNGAYGAYQGWSVALSADGNTAIVGGPRDNSAAGSYGGAAWVYTRSGSVWSQQSGKLLGGPYNGSSVGLSADGNTAMVGGQGDQNAPVYGVLGTAWVYTRSGSVWQQGRPVGPGAAGSAQRGLAAALSGDGKTVIIGGQFDNGGAGAAWLFVISTGPSIASGGVVNGASFLPGIAPGTWITVQGANLSATTRTWSSSDFSGSNLPTQLDGVSITVNGKSAYVYYISPTQLNALTPDDAKLGSVSVQVTTGQGKSNVVNAEEAALSPGLFTFSAQGRTYVAAVRADGAYIGPTLPAKPGETVLLYGTGFGPTTPPNLIGQLVNAAPLASQVTVRIGGIPADTQFAGIVSPGLYQFNVVVPSVPDGDNGLLIEIGGGLSQANTFLTIHQ